MTTVPRPRQLHIHLLISSPNILYVPSVTSQLNIICSGAYTLTQNDCDDGSCSICTLNSLPFSQTLVECFLNVCRYYICNHICVSIFAKHFYPRTNARSPKTSITLFVGLVCSFWISTTLEICINCVRFLG